MEVGAVCDTLECMISTIESIITEAREIIDDGSVNEFVTKKVGCLGKLIGCYGRELKKLGITKREELDNFLKQNFSSSDRIRDAVTELDQAENDWESFLREVDTQLLGSSSQTTQPSVGDKFTLDSKLIDVDTGEAVSCTSLQTDQAEFGGSVKFVVVSFGVLDGAKRWREETECPYKLYIDPDRTLYQYVGLSRSIYKTWNIGSITYYGEQIAQGRQLPKSYSDIEDDPHQMGGDFVLSKDGNFLLVHCSSYPRDRPSVDTLLSVCR